MQLRALGRSGLAVAPLAFGGNVFGWTADEATSFRAARRLRRRRLQPDRHRRRLFALGPGHSGGEIAKRSSAAGSRRAASATGSCWPPRSAWRWATARWAWRRAYIRQAVDDSLRRLQTDHIDLYQSHQDDPKTPLEETLGAFADLIREGKVRAIGASQLLRRRGWPRRCRPARGEAAALRVPAAALQPVERAAVRGGARAALPREGLGVIHYFGLASGFLTGKYRSEADPAKSPRGGNIVKKYLNDRGRASSDALDSAAAQHKATPAQVAIAWQIARPGLTAPIASATSLAQ